MKLTKDVVNDVYKDLQHLSVRRFGIPLILKNDICCSEGGTSVGVSTGKVYDIYVGVGGVILKGIFSRVDEKLFSQTLVNIFHEFQHIEQIQAFEDMSVASDIKTLAFSSLSTRHNSYYYLSTGNYCHFPHEIDAEKHGFQGAYAYLCEAFPDVPAEEHEKLLLSVIEANTDGSSLYYIPRRDYQSLDEVYQAFDEAFQKSKEDRRLYFVGAWRRCEDPAFLYMVKPENSAFIDEFNNAPNGLECDRLVSRMTVI